MVIGAFRGEKGRFGGERGRFSGTGEQSCVECVLLKEGVEGVLWEEEEGREWDCVVLAEKELDTLLCDCTIP